MYNDFKRLPMLSLLVLLPAASTAQDNTRYTFCPVGFEAAVKHGPNAGKFSVNGTL